MITFAAAVAVLARFRQMTLLSLVCTERPCNLTYTILGETRFRYHRDVSIERACVRSFVCTNTQTDMLPV